MVHSSKKNILIALQEKFLQGIQPLVKAYNANGIECDMVYIDEGSLVNTSILKNFEHYDAVLFLGPGKRSPRNVAKAPFLLGKDNKRIPLGIVPIRSQKDLDTFVKTTASIHERKKGPIRTAILSQRQPRYVKVATRIESLLQKNKKQSVHRWTGEIMFQEDMIQGLRSGIGCALYLGHGRPVGWAGYYGTRIHHFKEVVGEPLGAIISLCCLTASRKRTGLSFSESLILNGIASASMGAISETLFTDNTRWAIRLSDSLNKGISTIGELIADSCPPHESSYKQYRLMGDPLAPLFSWKYAKQKINNIKVYA